MLYIFLVNTGTMMTFDMNLAIDTVENLKWAICEEHHIPVECQVLLISGGDSLKPDDRVCEYSSAGTDTSPIFLFCKNLAELEHSSLITIPGIMGNIDDDMKDRVESCLQMEPNYNTVASRNQMAFELYEKDSDIYHNCEKLVHEQHLQQQSWAAVVANLEDLVQSFKAKAEKVEYLFTDILKNKSFYQSLVENFDYDKQILSKIPILKSLIPKTENFTNVSMLEWIMGKDSQNSLDELNCLNELNEYDLEKLNNLKISVENVLKGCTNFDMKEIKGLSQRLSTLEKYICGAKNMYNKQSILSAGFQQNQTRMSEIHDPSILPDLCQNHREQLESMLSNHLELIDYHNKCMLGKRELSHNLNQRIRWIIHVEEQLKNVDERLVVMGIKLQKLRNKIEIVQSLHASPQIYFNSIVEVLRRKTFTEKFYNWAENISKNAKQLVEKEIESRKLFSGKLENHFLKFFFPGMTDLPENFVVEPTRIDKYLPQISMEDIEFLKKTLPEMSHQLVVPSTVPVNFLNSDLNLENNEKSEMDQRQKASSIEKRDMSTSTTISLDDIKYLESSKIEMQKFLMERNETIDELSSKLTTYEINDIAKSDLLKSCEKKFKELADSIVFIKNDLISNLKNQLIDQKKNFLDDLENFKSYVSKIQDYSDQICNRSSNHQIKINEMNEKLKELDQEISQKNCLIESIQMNLSEKMENNQKCHEKIQELSSILPIVKKFIQDQNLRFQELKQSFDNLQNNSKDHQEHMNLLLYGSISDELKNFEEKTTNVLSSLKERHQIEIEKIKQELLIEKEQEIQNVREQVIAEYRSEIESLRHRFKLAISTTSIERTSSETSLEKVQLDIVDQSAQEKEIQILKSLLYEQKAEYEIQLGLMKNTNEATISLLKEEFAEEIEDLKSDKEISIQCLKAEFENERKRLLKKIPEMEFNQETNSYKISLYENLFSRINEKLSDQSLSSSDTIKSSLSQELNEFKRNLDLINSRSFISLPATISDSPTTTINRNSILNLESLLEIDDTITVNSCEIGDIVLVYYEKKLENFIVFQLSETLHYIHSDSLKECDIQKEPSGEYEWIIAKIAEKEYCQIKKEENRYKLPVNTKFYRVKIQKISKWQSSNINKLKNIAQKQLNRFGIGNGNGSQLPTTISSLSTTAPQPPVSLQATTSSLPSSSSTSGLNIIANFVSLFTPSSNMDSQTSSSSLITQQEQQQTTMITTGTLTTTTTASSSTTVAATNATSS